MKKIVQIIIVFFLTFNAFSQSYTPPSFAEIDNNYRNYANNLFGQLEGNRVSTGLLMDYAFDFTDPKIYNGSVLVDSTLMKQGIYSELYKSYNQQCINNNKVLHCYYK